MASSSSSSSSSLPTTTITKKISAQCYSYYYEHLFPYTLIIRFLSRTLPKDNDHLLSHREFSADYCVEGLPASVGMVKTRWKSFSSSSDFKSFLSTPYGFLHPCIQGKKLHLPLGRIHIGAHYNLPCSKKSDKLIPEFKEFVVDIDLSDYDDIRTCCDGKTACSKCWIFIRAATKAITLIMDEAFDYSKILWIYSGRRGVHGWFYDDDIHLLPRIQREAMMKAINFIDPKTKRLESNVNFTNTNALLVFKGLIDIFCELLVTQHLLIHEKGLNYFKQVLNPNFFAILISIPAEKEMDRIERLCNHLLLEINSFLYFRIVLELLYPRFDTNVTTDPTHLIGCPFAAHLDTGNLAIPIDPDTFNIDVDPINISSFTSSHSDKKATEIEKLNKAIRQFELILAL